jgi:hypothetical protein
MDNESIIKSLRDWKYMSGEDRSKERVNSSGEVFTPDWLVDEMIDNIPEEILKDKDFVYSDSSCGDSQILAGVVIKLIKLGFTHEQALNKIRGTDIFQGNVDLSRTRLICGNEKLKHIVDKNIICKSGLTNWTDDLFTDITTERIVKEEKKRKSEERKMFNFAKKQKEERQLLEKIKNFENTEEENAKAKKSKITKSKAKKVN